jgi:hypothetical protein
MFKPPLEHEVGKLRLPPRQLLLIRRVRPPFECRMVRGDQPRHARYVADHDRGRYCAVEEAGGGGVRHWRCLARNCALWVSGSCLGTVLTRSVQETDKATIDVEAQEDGILGKILVRKPRCHGPHTLAHPTPVYRPRMAPRMCPSARSLPCSPKKETISRISNLRLRRRNRNQHNNLPHRNLRPQSPSQPQPHPHPLLRNPTPTSSTLGRCSHPFSDCFRSTTLPQQTKSREPASAECSPKEMFSLTWVSPLVPPAPSRRSIVWMSIKPNRHRSRRRLSRRWMDLQSDSLSSQICLLFLLALALVQVLSLSTCLFRS